MINDVLVCLEGSASGEAAMAVAIAIGRELGARLSGVAIVDEPDIRAGVAAGIGTTAYKHERDDALMVTAKRLASDWITLFESRCREGGVSARAHEITGRPAASIVSRMRTSSLTVIGRDANFRFATEDEDPETRAQVIRHGERPVLLVPEGTSELGKRVVVAFDGSAAAKRAATSFANSGLAQAREIHVVTVDDDGARAWDMANRGVAIFRAAGLVATAENVVSPLSNAEAILQASRELGAGLIVMGAFAHSRLAGLFRQSAMRTLLEKSDVPLFVQN
jgi:nucleotide-binding universal stress UspA family protein